MRLRQTVALLLSTDLHAVARRLQKADVALQKVQGGLASIAAGGPTPGTGAATSEVYAGLHEIGLDLAAARYEVITARSDLTGRGPAAILEDPNRG